MLYFNKMTTSIISSYDLHQEPQTSGSRQCCATGTRLGSTTAREGHVVNTRTGERLTRPWDRTKGWTLSGWRDGWRISAGYRTTVWETEEEILGECPGVKSLRRILSQLYLSQNISGIHKKRATELCDILGGTWVLWGKIKQNPKQIKSPTWRKIPSTTVNISSGYTHPLIKHITDSLEANSWLVGSRSYSKESLAIVLWICSSHLALVLFCQFFLL